MLEFEKMASQQQGEIDYEVFFDGDMVMAKKEDVQVKEQNLWDPHWLASVL